MAISFEKQFKDIVDDFDAATQSAFGVLKKGVADEGELGPELKQEMKELDKEEDDLLGGLDKLVSRVVKSLKMYDYERRELEGELKSRSKDDNGVPEHADDFDESFDTSKKCLEKFLLRVRADFGGRKDLGDKFPRAAAAFFADLKKLQTDIRKDSNKLLNKAEGAGEDDDKPMQVEATTFLVDFKKIFKSIAKDFDVEKDDDAKVKKFKETVADALDKVDDRLKRVDTNHSFDKVEPLCDAAAGGVRSVIKALSGHRDYSGTVSDLNKLLKEIEAYDKKMFLFARLKNS